MCWLLRGSSSEILKRYQPVCCINAYKSVYKTPIACIFLFLFLLFSLLHFIHQTYCRFHLLVTCMQSVTSLWHHFLFAQSNLVPSVAPAVAFTPWEVCTVDKGAKGINRGPDCLLDYGHKMLHWCLKSFGCKWTKLSEMIHGSPCQATVLDDVVTVLAGRTAPLLLNGWTEGDTWAGQWRPHCF